ncbi:MAG: hypothetical protein ABFC96_01990 [Thermoguttaceae bacterium]
MRLTLRTLLAYLDGLLDPKVADELGKKIEESEYATTLVHRIRDAMRRLRLGAPSVTERGAGFDANTVAEYLDNTLDAERVSEFEKVCLDSDVHLAEVAACHQILTLVLGEPAEVDAATRDQMYQLKDRTGHAPPLPPVIHPRPESSGDGGPQLDLGDVDFGDRKARPRPTVPEYLREPRRKPVWLSIVAAVVLVICITGVVLKSLGQFEPETPVGKLLVDLGVLTAPAEPGKMLAKGQAGDDAAATKGRQSETPATESVKTTELGKGAEPIVKQPAAKEESAAQRDNESITIGGGPKDVSPPVILPKPPVEPVAPASVPAGKSTAPATPAAPQAKEPTAVPPATSTEPAAKTPPTPAAPTGENPKDKPPENPSAAQPEPMGRLMSNDQLLLSRDEDSEWTRVTANQMLTPQQILVLPTYRAKVALTVGVTVEILGGTRVDLLGTAAPEPPGVRIVYGRVVLMPLAKPGSKLRVAFGDHSGTITFIDADSAAAIDVRRLHAPGTNPETAPGKITATLYAGNGAILWQESTKGKPSEPMRLASLQRMTFEGESAPAPAIARELPRWLTAEPIKEIDRRASLALAEAMGADAADKAARLGLLELATTRPQREVRWLALRCLGYLGQFSEMVGALDDLTHKGDWQDNYLDELRAAVARDPETAAAVRQALERRYPQQAADLYRMLCGYTDKDLQSGEDAKLVRGLEDDSLAVRRLSFWNLRDITTLGLFYQPEQTAAKRQVAARAWRQRLDAKEIRFRNPDGRPTASSRLKAAEERAVAPDREPLPPPATPPGEPESPLRSGTPESPLR